MLLPLQFAFIGIFAEFLAQFGDGGADAGIVHVAVEGDAHAAQDRWVDFGFQFNLFVRKSTDFVFYGEFHFVGDGSGGDEMREHYTFTVAIELYKSIGDTSQVDGATLPDDKLHEHHGNLVDAFAEQVAQDGGFAMFRYDGIGEHGVQYAIGVTSVGDQSHIVVYGVEHAGVRGDQEKRFGVVDIDTIVFHSVFSIEVSVLYLFDDKVVGAFRVGQFALDEFFGYFDAEVGNLIF